MKPYVRPEPLWWWLQSKAYMLFVLREFTSVFIAAYLVLLLRLVQHVAAGPAAYQTYLRWLASPWVLAFQGVALLAAVYHSVTWLRLTPMTVVVRVRGRRIPAVAIVTANVVAWAALSIILVWLVGRA